MKFKKRPTKRLAEVIDSDLLTATEKIIKGELGGFYCITDEAAYFKTSRDKAQMTVAEFESHLRKTVDPNFFIVYNPNVTPEHMVHGHQIGLYIDAYKGFVPFIKVGKSADKIIPANSQGKVQKYEGARFRKTHGVFIDEEPLLWRGWVAAEEACKQLIVDIQQNGLSPSRCITPAEFFMYKRMIEKFDGAQLLHEVMQSAAEDINAQMRADAEAEEQAIAEKNAEEFLIALDAKKAEEKEKIDAI